MIDIAACTDKGFVMPTGVMMHSVSKTHADIAVTFHVLTDKSVSEKQKQQLEGVIVGKLHTVVFYSISSKQYEKDKRWRGGFTLPPAAYYRLSLAEILPKDIDRVLYLDGDIAVNGRIDELFCFDLNNIPVMASLSFPPNIKKHTERLRYDNKYGYFNSGVLLVNLKWWRDNDAISIFEHIMIKAADYIVLHDQDVLNMAFYQQKHLLPLSYNAQPWIFGESGMDMTELELIVDDIKDAQQYPVVIHYCGRAKPWHSDCQHPLLNVFRQNLLETPWKNMKMHKSWMDSSFRDKFYYIIGRLKSVLKH